MNDWVGGSDPEAVGDACNRILERYLTFSSESRVLDFGCGIGRVLLSLLKYKPDVGLIAGFDIIPQVIGFCETHIATVYPTARFELIEGSNDHYDEFIKAGAGRVPKSLTVIQSEYGATFTDVYAFSVFTHLDKLDCGSLLALLGKLLRPGGALLFTAFLLTPFSRQAIAQRTALFPFGSTAYEDAQAIFIGNTSDRLGFIAYDFSLIQEMVFNAGLVTTHIEHGSWTGAGFSSSLQDVIVCRRPKESVGPTQFVPTVLRPPRM